MIERRKKIEKLYIFVSRCSQSQEFGTKRSKNVVCTEFNSIQLLVCKSLAIILLLLTEARNLFFKKNSGAVTCFSLKMFIKMIYKYKKSLNFLGQIGGK